MKRRGTRRKWPTSGDLVANGDGRRRFGLGWYPLQRPRSLSATQPEAAAVGPNQMKCQSMSEKRTAQSRDGYHAAWTRSLQLDCSCFNIVQNLVKYCLCTGMPGAWNGLSGTGSWEYLDEESSTSRPRIGELVLGGSGLNSGGYFLRHLLRPSDSHLASASAPLLTPFPLLLLQTCWSWIVWTSRSVPVGVFSN